MKQTSLIMLFKLKPRGSGAWTCLFFFERQGHATHVELELWQLILRKYKSGSRLRSCQVAISFLQPEVEYGSWEITL